MKKLLTAAGLCLAAFAAQAKDVVLIGDSLMGFDSANFNGLEEQGFRVRDMAQPGKTLQDANSSKLGVASNYYSPDRVAVIMLGTNDWGRRYDSWSTVFNYYILVKSLDLPAERVICLGQPTIAQGYLDYVDRDKPERFDYDLLYDIAAGMSDMDLCHYRDLRHDFPDPYDTDLYLADGLHLSPRGVEKLVEIISEEVKNIP